VSASRRASTRVANGESSESNKKGAKRVKSPKSKSPAPAAPPPPQSVPSSAIENEDASDTVIQLKGHEAEVCGYVLLMLAANLESIRSSFVLGTLPNIIY
jgi:hypothetical protein